MHEKEELVCCQLVRNTVSAYPYTIEVLYIGKKRENTVQIATIFIEQC